MTAPLPERAIVSVTPQARLLLDPRDYVSGLVYRGLYERAEAALVSALVDEGDHALDVGANVGWFTALLASRVGPSGGVIAVEPGPGALASLRPSLSHLPPNVTLLEHALGAEEGTATLYVAEDDQMGLSSMADPGRGRPVVTSVRTVDHILTEAGWEEVAFVKVDVEGFEPQVFAGAVDLVGGGRARALLVEVLPELGGGSWAAGLLDALGAAYSAFEVMTVKRAAKVSCRLRVVTREQIGRMGHQCNLLLVRADAVARLSRFTR